MCIFHVVSQVNHTRSGHIKRIQKQKCATASNNILKNFAPQGLSSQRDVVTLKGQYLQFYNTRTFYYSMKRHSRFLSQSTGGPSLRSFVDVKEEHPADIPFEHYGRKDLVHPAQSFTKYNTGMWNQTSMCSSSSVRIQREPKACKHSY